MKAVIVYKPESEMTGKAEGWKKEFEFRTGRKMEVVNPETREGEGYCTARGIIDYPAVVVESENDGKVSFLTQGETLPLFDEVMAYL